MQSDHDQFQKVIVHLTELGVKISKTKSRLEIKKALDNVKPVRSFSGLHS